MRKLTLVATLSLVLWLPAIQARQPNPEIRRYALPAAVTFPEGIAYDEKDDAAFAGSMETQAIGRVSLDRNESRVVSPAGALFPDMHGLTVDDAGRLWVAGGRSGQIAVLDSRTGRILKRFQTPVDPAPLINDVAVVGSSAYFTDTWRPTLFRITFKGNQFSEPEPWLQFKGTSLEYTEGANLNGIAGTTDGRYLIVVQTNTGRLFRVGVADKSVTPVDLEAIPSGDGLVLDGRRVYLLRPTELEIVTIQLSEDLTKGSIISRFTNAALKSPTTAVKAGDRLLVVNSQLNRRSTKNPDLPFEILAIPLSMLSGK